MNLTKDTYEYVLNFADDRTILMMLSTNKKFRNEELFKKIMERKYPFLIKYKKSEEDFKDLFIKMIYYMAKLREYFDIVYQEKFGDPEKHYNELKMLIEKERKTFVIDADNWYDNMPPGENIPFQLDDPEHRSLNKIRKNILNIGGKVVPETKLDQRAKLVWAISKDMQKRNLFEALGYTLYYTTLSNKLKEIEDLQDNRF